MFCMRPAAITLNYSIKNIQNDVRQIIIYIYILYEKSQLNRLVWGSLTLAPISNINKLGYKKATTLTVFG